MIKIIILVIFLLIPCIANATVTVNAAFGNYPVSVCTPSDSNSHCGGSGGSQTPWTSNINGAGYYLGNAGINWDAITNISTAGINWNNQSFNNVNLGTFNGVGIGTAPSSSYPFYIYQTSSSANGLQVSTQKAQANYIKNVYSSNAQIGLSVFNENTASIGGTTQSWGIEGEGLVNNINNAGTFPVVVGVTGLASSSSSSTNPSSIGVYGECTNTGSGTTTSCYSVYGDAPTASSGSITNSWAGYFNGKVGIVGALSEGTLSYSDTGTLASFQSSTNSYNQLILQNTNSGSSASTNLIVSNNLGTATTYYGEFGMDSSNYSGTGSLNQANTVYLESTQGDLAIGTLSSNAIHFVVDNGSADAVTINSSNQVKIPLLVSDQLYGIADLNNYVNYVDTTGDLTFGDLEDYYDGIYVDVNQELLAINFDFSNAPSVSIYQTYMKTSAGVNIVMSGSSSGTTTLKAASTASGTLTFPSATDTLVGRQTTDTLTNKRITPRSSSTSAPGATPSMDTDNYDIFIFTGLAANITSMTTNLTGTPVTGDKFEVWLTDNGTARTITWGTSFNSTTTLLPATTVISTRLRVKFEYNGSSWDCVAVT